MKKIYYILSALFLCVVATSAQEAGKTVVIKTNVGTMKAILYDDVPNHTRTFIERAKRGDFNGTLFTRVLPEFMIQGGAPDSKNAPAGAKCGFGDPSAEILPEINEKYFHKKGALAAPRQPDDVNPQKKSDMSQFFIVQGKVYRETELDTLERTANYPARQKALKEFYAPVRAELNMIKMSNKREYQKRLRMINAQIDSVIQATPGHLLFTDEQRKAYTTVGGCHHLDGTYTIFGERTEGFDVLDQIATQPKDQNDRPKKDIRIQNITIE